jgi:hypothetical protein
MKSIECHIIGRGPGLNVAEVQAIDQAKTPIFAVNHAINIVPHAEYFVTVDINIMNPKLRTMLSECENTHKIFVGCWMPYRVKWEMRDGLGRVPVDQKNGIVYDLTPFDEVLEAPICEGFALNQYRSGGNSGHAAVSVAIMMGYKIIHLHGFDFQIVGGQWHYDERVRPMDKNPNERYAMFFDYFLAGLPFCKEHCIRFINHSPLSRLIPHMENQIK